MKIVQDLVLGSIAERREAARNALRGFLSGSLLTSPCGPKLSQKQNEVYKLMADENWEAPRMPKRNN